ncbi:MAG: hypothetical protein JRI23_12725 [Deltaproteobacteria bacterium]|jgi:hypothetical protein|nr:hypothetical protein [Deltaproteobacteria bacterium]MBW2532579.1 hypothetical protein [Deltaproteobacteria bacterium]
MGRAGFSVAATLGMALAACGGDPSTGADGSYDTEQAVLAFHSDWRIEQSGPLVEGGRVLIDYDAARLTACRGDLRGQPAWTITGYHSLAGAPPKPFYVAGFSAVVDPPQPSIELDRAGDLEVWFQNTSIWGCSAYDSSFGANFHFQVGDGGSPPDPSAEATVHFGADGTMSVEGSLRRGGRLFVDYAAERLEDCRGDQYGSPAWTITGYAGTADDEAQSFYVAGHSATGQVGAPVVELIRSGEIELWFHNTNRWGCSAYDSDFGANYRLTVE